MIINYETEKIKKALHDFNNATGIKIGIFRTDFTAIVKSNYESNNYCRCIQTTSKGIEGCNASDEMILKRCRESKKNEMHICHAGLIDVAVPILYEDEILGYIIFGEIKTKLDFSGLKPYIAELRLDEKMMEEYYSLIPVYDSSKIESISNIASMLVKYIMLEKMLKPDLDKNLQKAVNYINDNLDGDLSIKNISKGINISKSVLYKKFHEHFSCTISEYINERRIEKSMDLLKKTDMSIEEISQKVGFSNTSYYSRTFKSIRGISPLKYRKRADG